jgi:tetratricopeptide (TPR) repeat protein
VERRPIARGVYRKPSVPQPVVFVLPGIMGSHLEVNGNRIWLDIFDLAAGGLGKLEIGDPGVQAQGLVASTYADLVEYLSACHEVVTFPYDWRRSIGEEAARFADEVAAKLDEAERHAQPVRILAHSMGGLVARAMIAERPDLWERIRRNPGGRLLMLGTPNGGSHVIPRLLVGQEQLFRYIALLDLRHDQEELLGIVARYPGILEMMPVDPALDLFDAGGWERIRRADGGKWALPKSEELARARELRRHLSESSIDTERMLYLAGRARSTPWRLLLGEGTRDHSVRFQATPQGDGRVPWSTGIPEGVRAWYVDAEHGELAAHEPSFPAIRELLETGDTQRLPTTPPAPERGVPASFDLPPDPVDLFPDQGALEAAALGFHRRSRPTVRPRLIRVSVTHGNLAYARHVVAVGHYQGDTIVSAEEDLDRMLGGGLRRAHLLGIYPGALGTSELFAQQRSGSRPAGVLVIGLGRVGELHPGDLTQTFTQALLRYVLEQMARRPEEGATEPHAERRPFTLSTLLIGSTAGSLSVQDAVTALLRAVCRANQALDARQVPAMVAEIELLELWEDRAIQAARALATLQAVPDLRQVFDWEALVRKARGAGSRIVRDEASGWWQRLQILGERDGSLRFNVMSGQARAETTLLPTQRALVDRFIERAIRSTHGDHEVGRTLFEILVPNRLKERVPDREDLILVLDEAAARYPWELLEDRSSPASGPLAVDKGLLRQLETPVFREQVSMTHQNTALVVGDPLSSFPELPGAQDETNAVWECLAKGGYRATKQIRANAETIVAALHADAYRIVHLAGHGVYEHHVAAVPQSCSACGQELPEQEERVSGMVIGDGVFLTAGDVEQMRRVPELVFVNCCHLGRIEDTGASGRRDFHRLAANLAAQFIRMGVRAVIAAGWAVNDGAAKTFAERFFGELLDGKVFGEAVRAARRETHDAHPSVNTWGAYQCYGDPDFALAPPSGARDEAGAPEPRFVAVSEAVLELESLANEAATAGPQRRAEIGRTLEKLKNGLPEAWRHDARLLAALGRLYGEFGHFREALEQYRAALRSEDAELALKTVEQMVNLQGRYAVALWRRLELKSESGPPPPNPADQIDEAIARLEQLLGLGQTVERLRLAASAYKRKALVTRGKSRREALEKMADYYRKVHEQALGVAEEVDPCPLLGALFAETILGWKKGAGDQAGQREWEQRLQTAEGAARIRNQRQPNFSDTVAAAEARLVRLLATEKFAARACARARKKIVTEYRRARDRAASPREFASVLDQLDFLLEMVESEAGAETRSRGLSELLHAICEDIARLG